MFTTESDNIIITTIQLHYDHNEIIPFEVSMQSRKWHNIPVITSAFYCMVGSNESEPSSRIVPRLFARL